MVLLLSAYIAASCSDRPGIAPGIIGGQLAVNVGAGFIGGIVTGLVAGIAAYYLKKIPLPKINPVIKGNIYCSITCNIDYRICYCSSSRKPLCSTS